MSRDWLFQFPEAQSMSEQVQILADRVAADPIAAAISDKEAEQFSAYALALDSLAKPPFEQIRMNFGIARKDRGERSRRQVIIRMLRLWRIPRHRSALQRLVINTSWSAYNDVVHHPDEWTEEQFQKALGERVPTVWVTQIRRHLHPEEDIREWLRSTLPLAEADYDFWLHNGRLLLRRLIYASRVDPASTAMAHVAVAQLADELQQKDRRTASLRQNQRRLEQDRKRLKYAARQARLEKRALLTQARGEVAAARRALVERRAARERELAKQQKQYEAKLQLLRVQLAAARTDLFQQLDERKRPRLLGRAIATPGFDPEAEQKLVESLGARWVPAPDTPEVTPITGKSLADLERGLHQLLLHEVEIRCDGLRRKKGTRPAIAAGAFQVYAGGQVIHRDGEVVACGPKATSMMAEYAAVTMALRWLLSTGAGKGTRVVILSDCLYMVQHLMGTRTLGDMQGCVQLDERLRSMMRTLQRRGCAVILKWVRRVRVEAEDRLCDFIYRQAGWYHLPKPETRPLSLFLKTLASEKPPA